MAKKGLRKKKRSSQKVEETSKMSNVCDVEIAQETHQLGSVLRRIVDQIDDAERSNSDTLHEMQERLSSLSEQTSEAKASEAGVDKEALDKIENQIEGLSNRIEIISQGRSISADNLEVRIEALADKLSDDDNNLPDNEQKDIQEALDHSDSVIEEADITFVVTDNMDEEVDKSASSSSHTQDSNETDEEKDVPPSPRSAVQVEVVGSSDHKIQVAPLDVSGPIAPQKLASLAEHLSPVLHTAHEDNHNPVPPVRETHGQVSTIEDRESRDALEGRFALIATRLEETLAIREQDAQERVDISNKFDDLAAKFESWLSSNDSKSSFESIEKRIDALTDHVRKAESDAARIDTLEKHLLKLIDLVENNQVSSGPQNDFSDAFEKVATRILEEKSGQIADIVAAKVEGRVNAPSDTDRFKEIERSITALSSERRIADVNHGRDLSKLTNSIELMTGRLNHIEESLQPPEQPLSESHYDLHDDHRQPEEDDDGDNGLPLSLSKEISLSLDDDDNEKVVEDKPSARNEDDAFHAVLELSVNEALDTQGQTEFQEATNPPTLDSFKSENDQGISQPPDLSDREMLLSAPPVLDFVEQDLRSVNADNEFVETARRAAQEAYQRKEEASHVMPVESKTEQVIDSFFEKKEELVEKGKAFRKRLFNFGRFNISSILFICAAGLMVICFGILFKEIFYAVSTKGPQHLASNQEAGKVVEQDRNLFGRRIGNNSGKNKNDERIVPQVQGVSAGKAYSRGYQAGQVNKNAVENKSGRENGAERKQVNKSMENANQQREFSPYKLNVSASDNKSAQRTGEAAGGATQSESKDLERLLQTNRDQVKRQYQVDMKPALARQYGYLQIGQKIKRDNLPQYITKSDFDNNSDADGPILPPEKIGSLSLRNAAASGNYKAQFAVAMRYIGGIRVKRNYPAALRWLKRSASQSFAPAQFQLALLYENGLGADPDPGKAKTWYMRAARRGNVKAMHNLAVLFSRKTDVEPDFPEAIQWFRRAASYGYATSLFKLGMYYKSGFGVKADKIEAYKWFSLANSRGDIRAEKELNTLKFNMSEDDVFHAEAAIAQWSQRAPNRASNLTEKEVAAFTGRIMPPFADALIYEAQVLLNKLGYDVGPADGQIGPKTRDAVRSFQMKNGLEATGQITPRFISHLSRSAG